jgi:hypothetical protein
METVTYVLHDWNWDAQLNNMQKEAISSVALGMVHLAGQPP